MVASDQRPRLRAGNAQNVCVSHGLDPRYRGMTDPVDERASYAKRLTSAHFGSIRSPESGTPPFFGSISPPDRGPPPFFGSIPPLNRGPPPFFGSLPPPDRGPPPFFSSIPPLNRGSQPFFGSIPPPRSGPPSKPRFGQVSLAGPCAGSASDGLFLVFVFFLGRIGLGYGSCGSRGATRARGRAGAERLQRA